MSGDKERVDAYLDTIKRMEPERARSREASSTGCGGQT